MWWRYQLDAMLAQPLAAWSFSSKAFIGHIGALSGQARTGQTRRWVLASGKQGGCQVLIMGAGRPKAKAGNDSGGRDTEPQVKAFIPAYAIAPANIRLPSQPTGASTFGITGHCRGTIQDLIEAVLRLQEVDQKQGEPRDVIPMLAQQSIELAAIRQVWKRGSQVMLRVAIKRSFTGKLHPLAKERQGDHFTALQRRQRSWRSLLLRGSRLAKIINHDVQCSQEGIQIDHQRAPFLTNWFDKLTVRPGYRSFQVLSISHQTFKNKIHAHHPVHVYSTIDFSISVSYTF
jgi:hypothetical protein